MKVFMRVSLIFTLLSSIVFGRIITVEYSPDVQFVEVSKNDINRIVCPTKITGVVYSKEKEIEIKREGRNAFVKFLPRQIIDPTTGRIIRRVSSFPRTVYVECGGQIFSLVLIPKDVPPTIIILKTHAADIEKAYAYEKEQREYEKLITDLIKRAYFENPPEGYMTIVENTLVKEFKELTLILSKRYRGVAYEVEEYLIIARQPIELYEEMFIPYLKNPVAISIEKPKLAEGEQTRMFVVRRR